MSGFWFTELERTANPLTSGARGPRASCLQFVCKERKRLKYIDNEEFGDGLS